MAKARKNPQGISPQPGSRIVRTKHGEFTHLHNPKTGFTLCESGKNAGRGGKSGAVPSIEPAKAKFVTCYRCLKLI